MKAVWRLFSLSTIFFLLSCVPPRVEMPSYEGVDVRDILYSRDTISSIDTTFSITFEKDDTEMRGDGVLTISRNGNLNLRVYSFGFLGLELSSEDGIIKSVPRLDRGKSTILTQGLRDCLFWWDIKGYEIDEKDGVYLLRTSMRKIWIDRKTMLPIKQTLSLEDGRELTISYEGPEKVGTIWYPLKIRIELSHYFVTLKIREILFNGSI